jgi:4-hydroxybenzoate polyprenyltransferase
MPNTIANPYLVIKNPYLLALRPKQWTKNLIVFAAPLFGFKLDFISLLSALLAFVLFCATSSSFYLINDLLDVEADRQHPVKRYRPIASGLVPVPVAIAMVIILLWGALAISLWRSPLLGLMIF